MAFSENDLRKRLVIAVKAMVDGIKNLTKSELTSISSLKKSLYQ